MKPMRVVQKLMRSVLIGCLVVTTQSAHSDDITAIYEAKMRLWKPKEINNRPLPESLRFADMVIEGEYTSSGTFIHVSWKVKNIGKGRYSVEFQFGNCTTTFGFKRTARYENGVLILNKPVMDSSSGEIPPYNRLYTVRFENRDYLLPDRDVVLLDKNDPIAKAIGYPRRDKKE